MPGEVLAAIKEVIKEIEDQVSLFLNGGPCTNAQHQGATPIQKLVMLKMLRMEMPHQSMQMAEICRAIDQEVKKLCS